MTAVVAVKTSDKMAHTDDSVEVRDSWSHTEDNTLWIFLDVGICGAPYINNEIEYNDRPSDLSHSRIRI